MLRDSNNNKIRPPLSSTPPSTANVDQNLSTNNRTIPLCPTDLDPSSDMMAVSMNQRLSQSISKRIYIIDSAFHGLMLCQSI